MISTGRDGFTGWESVIRLGIGSAPKWCSRQAEFHYILSRRSPCGDHWFEHGSVPRRQEAWCKLRTC